MKTVFIDGSAGTTGLRIYRRLGVRRDLRLLTLPEDLRKDPAARRDALNSCDAAFLCLPDQAAVEAVSLLENPDVTVLDASTAHRTNPQWAYGFPELGPDFLEKVRVSKRIAVPGCHASGFLALVTPLIRAGLLAPTVRLTCHSVTGYSGGGKKMIAQYEAADRSALLDAPRQYALGQNHKHLREMTAVSGLENPPIFCPIVSDFYSGMAVTVPVFASDLAPGRSLADIRDVYKAQYQGPVVRYVEHIDGDGLFSAAGLSGLDKMEIAVAGNEERILLLARYDNLGKGASGGAIECLNLVLGCAPTTGLEI